VAEGHQARAPQHHEPQHGERARGGEQQNNIDGGSETYSANPPSESIPISFRLVHAG
jgi:hypothetical protein